MACFRCPRPRGRAPGHRGTVRLETKRLILRRFSVSDAADMFSTWASDPEVTRYLTWRPHESVLFTEQLLFEWERLYEDPAYYHWAICLRESGRPIGSIGVVGLSGEMGSVSVGYCLGRAFWNMGYMTEALSEVIRFLLYDVGIKTVKSYHAVLNTASGRVMQKCGMRRRGRIFQHCRTGDGVQTDVEAYAISKRRRMFGLI